MPEVATCPKCGHQEWIVSKFEIWCAGCRKYKYKIDLSEVVEAINEEQTNGHQ